MDKRYENARAARPNGMPQRDSTAIDIEFFRRDIQVTGRRHWNAGKGFVDFKQIDIRDRKGEFGQKFEDSTNRREREPLRLPVRVWHNPKSQLRVRHRNLLLFRLKGR